MARNERCKGGQGKTELENGGKRRGEMEEKEGKDKKLGDPARRANMQQKKEKKQ